MTFDISAVPEAGEHKAYDHVNSQWPVDMPKTMSAAEGITAAKKLYRFGFKTAGFLPRLFEGKVKTTSGRRYNWVRRGVLYVNLTGHYYGPWKDLVHDMSHYIHRKARPNDSPHSPNHAFLEREMIGYVVQSGWLEGKLKRESKPKPPKDLIRYTQILAGIRRWESKEQRAVNALKKLRKQAKYYKTKLEG